MDYEKAYKEALERAKKINSGEGVEASPDWTICEVLFPELRQNEDDEIRKAIIDYLKKNLRLEWATWLEKQGESKFEQCIQEGDKIVTNEDGTHFNVSQLERVGKKEPKFKVGQWIIDAQDGGILHINKVLEYAYEVTNLKGGSCQISRCSIETSYKPWTIQDAKDGDILQLGNVTVIFKEFIGSGTCRCYCSVCKEEFEIPLDDDYDNVYGCYNATPATKEQCDTLMKAIFDAGYTFDFEKKELNKIEQKPIWSKEDETALCDALWAMKQAAKIAKDENDMGNIWYAENWLKSLKERMKGE